jgi:hypothetical protein
MIGGILMNFLGGKSGQELNFCLILIYLKSGVGNT